ncbi:hypothetical protein MRX96_037736 [Rhipicephalus microplus]
MRIVSLRTELAVIPFRPKYAAFSLDSRENRESRRSPRMHRHAMPCETSSSRSVQSMPRFPSIPVRTENRAVLHGCTDMQCPARRAHPIHNATRTPDRSFDAYCPCSPKRPT